jgi:hypothetical protein
MYYSSKRFHLKIKEISPEEKFEVIVNGGIIHEELAKST